jgi:uncharacterized protein YjiK
MTWDDKRNRIFKVDGSHPSILEMILDGDIF